MFDATVNRGSTGRGLQAYLLGQVDFDDALRLQRRLVYEMAGDRTSAAVVVCEHPPLITVGRDGSREHIRYSPSELNSRGWPIRWVNRGGGCLLHAPGQVAVYPIIALDRHGLDVRSYLDRLQGVILETLKSFDLTGTVHESKAGVFIENRLVAHIGLAIRDWIAYFGVALNVNPDLEPFRKVLSCGPDEPTMTSMERERRSQVKIAAVRLRLVESMVNRFEFERAIPFHSHPVLLSTMASHVVAERHA